MEKNGAAALAEIVFGSANSGESKRIQQLVRKGLAYKIAPRVYTTNLADNTHAIVRRNWFRILAHLYPGAVLSHRSALECKPTPNGHIYLTYLYNKVVELPGLTIHLFKGKGPILDDQPFFEKLFRSQDARAFLENCMPIRKSEEAAKTLKFEEIAQKLAEIHQIHSNSALIRLKEQARVLAPMLGLEKEFKQLSLIINAEINESADKAKRHSGLLSNLLGNPFHLPTIQLMEGLYMALAGKNFPLYTDLNTATVTYQHFAFFESYFSQYLAGNEFELAEARHIIETGTVVGGRKEDGEDLLFNYQLVASKKEMAFTPKSGEAFLELLKKRHAQLLAARPNKYPGEFKTSNNPSGKTDWVSHELIEGTLLKAFDWYLLLMDPFAKAIYLHCLILEVKPFWDGNEVLALITMNAELSSRNLSKIIIPIVYADEYHRSLQENSQQRDCAVYIQSMLNIYAFSATVLGNTKNEMERYLRSCHAFYLPSQGKLRY